MGYSSVYKNRPAMFLVELNGISIEVVYVFSLAKQPTFKRAPILSGMNQTFIIVQTCGRQWKESIVEL